MIRASWALAIGLFLGLAPRTSFAEPPRMRCNACALLPPGTIGSDLTLTGTLNVTGLTTLGDVVPSASGSKDLGSSGLKWHDLNMAGTVANSVGSGFKAIAVTNNGAFIDFGGGANDQASSDGTTVTFAGPVTTQALTATSGTFSGVVALNSGAGNILTLGSNQFVSWPAGGAKISGDPSGNTYENLGGSTGTAFFVGTANVTTADVTSSGASNLQSYTLPANALATTGRCLRVTGWGTALNNANAKTVALVFGGQTLITKALTPSIATETWKLQAMICRSGASTQDIYAEAWNSGGTTVSSTDGNTVLYQAARVAGTQTDTATIVIKGTTTVATTTDVTMDGLTVEFM